MLRLNNMAIVISEYNSRRSEKFALLFYFLDFGGWRQISFLELEFPIFKYALSLFRRQIIHCQKRIEQNEFKQKILYKYAINQHLDLVQRYFIAIQVIQINQYFNSLRTTQSQLIIKRHMAQMSAYTVLDSVNKYRHGVLLGNYVQDKFGKDLEAKNPSYVQMANNKPTTKEFHNLNSSLYKPHEAILNHQPKNETFYQTSKGISQNQYKKPETQTSYNIFHQQQVNRKVPILENNPKKQQRQFKQSEQYQNTRYYLSNRAGNEFVDGGLVNYQATNMNSGLQASGASMEQIPDILTGEIWKGNHKNQVAKKKQQVGGQTGYGQESLATRYNGKPELSNVNPYSTKSLIKPQIARFEQSEYIKQVLPNIKGEHRDVLFGHGLHINEFQRNQLATTYDLSYNQQIKPQTQVNSFYNPDATQTAKKYHRQTVFQKTHQKDIPQYNQKRILGQEKLGRPYQPYTKTYDQNHLKNEYLRAPL